MKTNRNAETAITPSSSFQRLLSVLLIATVVSTVTVRKANAFVIEAILGVSAIIGLASLSGSRSSSSSYTDYCGNSWREADNLTNTGQAQADAKDFRTATETLLQAAEAWKHAASQCDSQNAASAVNNQEILLEKARHYQCVMAAQDAFAMFKEAAEYSKNQHSSQAVLSFNKSKEAFQAVAETAHCSEDIKKIAREEIADIETATRSIEQDLECSSAWERSSTVSAQFDPEYDRTNPRNHSDLSKRAVTSWQNTVYACSGENRERAQKNLQLEHERGCKLQLVFSAELSQKGMALLEQQEHQTAQETLKQSVEAWQTAAGICSGEWKQKAQKAQKFVQLQLGKLEYVERQFQLQQCMKSWEKGILLMKQASSDISSRQFEDAAKVLTHVELLWKKTVNSCDGKIKKSAQNLLAMTRLMAQKIGQ